VTAPVGRDLGPVAHGFGDPKKQEAEKALEAPIHPTGCPSLTREKWNIWNSSKASYRSPNYPHARRDSKRSWRPEFGGPRLDHQRFAVTGLPDT